MKWWPIIFVLSITLRLTSEGGGATFCPACPPLPSPSPSLLHHLGVTKRIANGEERITFTWLGEGENKVVIYFFDPRHPSHERVKMWLEGLKERYSFFLLFGDLRREEDQRVRNLLIELFRLPVEKRSLSPCLFLDHHALLGEREIVTHFEELMVKEKVTPPHDSSGGVTPVH